MNSTATDKKVQIQRRDYSEKAITSLPFVADKKVKRHNVRSFWAVEPTDNYGQACVDGYQFACDYLQFLKQNPSSSGMGILGAIVRDMARHDLGTETNGYSVGFMCFMDEMLAAAAKHFDFYRHDDMRAKQMAAIAAERELEGEVA